MKVLLVQPSSAEVYRETKVREALQPAPPLNLCLLAATLRPRHQVKLVDLEVTPGGPDAAAAAARDFAPDWVAVTFRTPHYEQARTIVKKVREAAPRVRVVTGGVHSTVFPEEVVRDLGVDAAAFDEGDESFPSLVDGVPFERIRGIAWRRDDGTVVRNLDAPLMAMDKLPVPAWDLVDLEPYRVRTVTHKGTPLAYLEFSRGCPARCVYCTNFFGRSFRAKSPARFVDEIEATMAAGFREFNVADDSFTTDTGRAIEVCREITRRGLEIPWCATNGLRVANVTEEFFEAASKAGLHLCSFGLETGNKQVLAGIKKGATLEQGRQAVEWARKYGIGAIGYFVLGLPGDTPETMEETIRFATELPLTFAKFSITVPLPGTELWSRWRDKIHVNSWEDFNTHRIPRALYDHPELAWDVIEDHYKRAYRRFYLRPRYMARRFFESLRNGRFLLEVKMAATMNWW